MLGSSSVLKHPPLSIAANWPSNALLLYWASPSLSIALILLLFDLQMRSVCSFLCCTLVYLGAGIGVDFAIPLAIAFNATGSVIHSANPAAHLRGALALSSLSLAGFLDHYSYILSRKSSNKALRLFCFSCINLSSLLNSVSRGLTTDPSD